jgi:MGT family glycosyltransferase
MATFLAYTSPSAGHLFPIVPGLLALRERGHDVHVRTAAGLVAGARAAGLDAEPLGHTIEVPFRGDGDLKVGLGDLMARGPAESADLKACAAAVGADALLVDVNAYGAAVAAGALGLPWATTLPSLLPLPGAGIPPYSFGMRPMRGPLGRVRDWLGWRVMERAYGAAMLPPLNELRAAEGLPPLRSPLDHVLSPDRILCLTGDPLEYPRADLHPKVRFTGALSWDPPAERPAWLDEPGDPWVLVTCSTEYQGDEALAAAAIEALRDEPVRVVITLADAYGQTQLPSAANVRLERFVPHGHVLGDAAAVVCHSGMGIVQKAIGAGVPIVAVPFGRDQPEVSRRVAESGAGTILRAKRLTPGRLRAAVRSAIGMREGARAAAARQHAAGGPSAFADAAEELVAAARLSAVARADERIAGRAAAGPGAG